jgi:RNA-directed DNA polymerase
LGEIYFFMPDQNSTSPSNDGINVPPHILEAALAAGLVVGGRQLLDGILVEQTAMMAEIGSEALAEESDESADKDLASLPAVEGLAPPNGLDLAALLRQATDATTLAAALNAALVQEVKEHGQRSNKPVSARAINYYAFHNAEKRYRTFNIPKKTQGQVRTIKAPDLGLLRLQRLLLRCLAAAFTTCDDAAHGFVPGRSVFTNALPHAGRRFVLNLDLRDFFPSTSVKRVVTVLHNPPFALPKPAAHLVAQLCCDVGSLPQGAPTSPLLTNAVCQRLDLRLRQLAQRHRCRYTRYADDLTFSSNRPAFSQQFHKELNDVLAAEGYAQNQAKQRLQLPHQRQEVTGLVVNERPNVPREYVRQIKAMLHNWETKGYEAASATLRQQYQGSKAGVRHKGKVPKLEKVLAGKIAYLGMIAGKQSLVFQKMQIALNALQDGC